MEKTLFLRIVVSVVLISIAVFSCKKRSEETGNQNIDKVQFTINGIVHAFNNKLFARYDPLLTDQYITQFSCFTKQSSEAIDSFSVSFGCGFYMDRISTPYKIENRWDFIIQFQSDRDIYQLFFTNENS